MAQDINYVSEFTQFINGYLAENKDVAEGQIEGRALLWDKSPINLDERAREAQSNIKTKPYPYSLD